MIRTGVIGLSEGNGHPFSFSAIVNGYDDTGFAGAGWPVIHDYLRRQSPDCFGFDNARVTHAWTQDVGLTRTLCTACHIPTACATAEDMLGQIDALIIARDDWQCHAHMAMPFLEQGVAVFVDKPLTLDETELQAFEPYLRTGRLMSCSGLRHAVELDPLRTTEMPTGDVRLINGTVLNGLDKYGIHLIEAVASLGRGFARPVAVTRMNTTHESFQIQLANGVPLKLDCLGAVGKTFHLSVFGQRTHMHFDLHDNFSAFRRTLQAFFRMVSTGTPPFDPEETLAFMRLLRTALALTPGATATLNTP